jgi:hypothetical protein
MTEHRSRTAKQPFAPPRLTVYGNLAEITRTLASMSGNDNGSGANTKSMA